MWKYRTSFEWNGGKHNEELQKIFGLIGAADQISRTTVRREQSFIPTGELIIVENAIVEQIESFLKDSFHCEIHI